MYNHLEPITDVVQRLERERQVCDWDRLQRVELELAKAKRVANDIPDALLPRF